jgi:hypothetical protein
MNESKQTIQKLRELLDSLEKDLMNEDDQLFLKNFDALEIPEIVTSVIDFLQPYLLPYEAAVYWRLLRLSVFSTGQQYVRASTSSISKGTISSSQSRGRGKKEAEINISSAQAALRGLEEKEVIVKAGDTTNEGTPYKICLPEEIPLCQDAMKTVVETEHYKVDSKKDLDYYNVRENRIKIFERDVYKCHYCKKQLTRFSATLDHIQPVSKGGDNSYENLITACLHCNSERGNKPVMDIIQKKNG